MAQIVQAAVLSYDTSNTKRISVSMDVLITVLAALVFVGGALVTYVGVRRMSEPAEGIRAVLVRIFVLYGVGPIMIAAAVTVLRHTARSWRWLNLLIGISVMLNFVVARAVERDWFNVAQELFRNASWAGFRDLVVDMIELCFWFGFWIPNLLLVVSLYLVIGLPSARQMFKASSRGILDDVIRTALGLSIYIAAGAGISLALVPWGEA